VPEAGQNPSAEDIFAFLDGRLSKYKWPTTVVFWPELPKSGYGKVPKQMVRKLLLERAEQGQEVK
jgi:fatty-acyl-CoA synthase